MSYITIEYMDNTEKTIDTTTIKVFTECFLLNYSKHNYLGGLINV